MKRFFVTKEVAYANGGGGAGTAATPDQLLDGSIGVYGIDPAAGATKNKNVLITATNDDAGFTEYVIAMGTAQGGPVVSPPIKVADTKAGFPNSVAPVTETAQTTYIGYNGTSGTLATPTIVDGDWGEVKVVRSTFGINQQLDKDSFEVSNLAAGATDYAVAAGIVAAIQARSENISFLDSSDCTVVSPALTAGAVFGGVATATVTSGSVVVATSADSTVGVGDYVKFNTNAAGDVYQVVAATTSQLTLDRPYVGASGVIANADTYFTSTAPAEAGVKLLGQDATVGFDIALGGVVEDATITYSVAASEGVGTYLTVSKEENLGRAFLGYHDQIDRRRPAPQTNAVSGSEYDIYRIESLNTRPSANEMNATFQTEIRVGACFVDGAGTSGQATFQTVIETLHGLTAGDLNPA